jgi:REP element-mobilizing transposase RayT
MPSPFNSASMAHTPHAADLRKGRFSQPGGVYLVTTVTRERLPVFENFKSARCVVHTLQTEHTAGRAMTLAFVVMPDHLHWLLTLGSSVSLSQVVRTVKSVVAHQLGGRIWQQGFHDHAVRTEEDLPAMGRYIVNNPVRAGLVRKAGQYSHWDAVWV